MSDLEPITRAENFWVNEGDLEPITRKEQYIKHLYDETQVIPEYPKTREEYFINKAGEELHDVTIEQLTATENKTYSEEGVAYSPVIVDVPLPDNAYLLKDIPNTPSPIATFTDGSDLPMPKLEVAVEPQQDLHGYDAPWVGGAGKNKLYIPDIAETTRNGVKLSCKNGVITINGTPSENFSWDLARVTLPSDSYTLSLNQAVSTSSFAIEIDAGNTFTPTGNPPSVNFNGAVTNKTVWIYFRTTSTFNNLVIKPMIRLATVSDATFAPYANICPISGFDECNINNSGKNLFGGAYNEYFPIHFNEDKVAIASADVPSEGTNPVQIAYYDKNKTLLDYWGLSTQYSTINNRVARSFTLPKESYYLRYITQSSANYQVEFGEANSAYEPYNGSTITIQLGDTYYGGKLDVVSGVLSTVPYYASYNGETLVGEWISDRDKYEVGTTPTIGAQVVNIGATPTTIQLTPTAVSSLLGQNNLWANTGDVVDGQYFSKEE